MDKQYGLDTLALHAGYEPDSTQHSISVPIYQTNAYDFGTAEHATQLFKLAEPGNIYTRLNNPTVAVLEDRINAMEGGVGALAMASGHAIIFNAILNLACAGDEIVSSRYIYGGAVNLLGVTLGNIGIKTHFVDADDLSAWESAVNDKTRVFFVEVVGNPNANVADIAAIAEVAHKHGIPLIVDSTFTTPALIKPIELGADLIIHSATKFLGGHGNSMAGVIVDSGNFQWAGNPRFPLYNQPDRSYHGINFGTDCGKAGFITRLRALLLRDTGACLSPFNAFMILTGIETLSLRMSRHCENALAVAEFLATNPKVETVNFPLLQGDKYYALAKKQLPKGVGSVFTFELKGGKEAGVRFLDSVKLLRQVANVGDSRSQVIHPASTTHSQLSEEQLRDSGISGGTVRLSIGIENIEDILADLEQAINAAV